MVQKLVWLVLLSALSAAPLAAADDAEDREAILFELDNLTQTRFLSNSQANIASPELLLDLYAQRDFLPAWNDQRQIGELISAIRATEADGLDPSDYHLEQVEFAYSELLAGRLATSEEWAAQDLILTDSLARLGYHQFFGKVNPYTLDPHWNFRRELNDVSPTSFPWRKYSCM